MLRAVGGPGTNRKTRRNNYQPEEVPNLWLRRVFPVSGLTCHLTAQRRGGARYKIVRRPFSASKPQLTAR